MDEKMRGLTCKQIQVDEIWGFIGDKQKNARRAGVYGDVWTFQSLAKLFATIHRKPQVAEEHDGN